MAKDGDGDESDESAPSMSDLFDLSGPKGTLDLSDVPDTFDEWPPELIAQVYSKSLYDNEKLEALSRTGERPVRGHLLITIRENGASDLSHAIDAQNVPEVFADPDSGLAAPPDEIKTALLSALAADIYLETVRPEQDNPSIEDFLKTLVSQTADHVTDQLKREQQQGARSERGKTLSDQSAGMQNRIRDINEWSPEQIDRVIRDIPLDRFPEGYAVAVSDGLDNIADAMESHYPGDLMSEALGWITSNPDDYDPGTQQGIFNALGKKIEGQVYEQYSIDESESFNIDIDDPSDE